MKPVTWLSNEVSEHVTPVVRDFFIQMYEHPETYLDPESKDGSSNQLIKFQLALKKIPNWTNTQIKKQIDEISVRCTWFKKLLVALFVAYVKMLSDGIRTSSKSRRLDVKLPTDEVFVHTCFVTCAHDIYEDPYVMKKSERERIEELDKRINACILKSIHKLIPTTDIINNFIPSTSDDVTFGEDDGGDDLPSSSEPQQQLGGGGITTTTEEKKADEDDLEEEPKTIPVPSSSLAAAGAGAAATGGGEGDDGDGPDLFPDAPKDKISTKE